MAPRNLVPNSPRRGIGGVTIENVANVGRYGSQAMPQNAPTPPSDTRFQPFTKPLAMTNPSAVAQRNVFSPEDLDAFLFGNISPTAGQKYAGFPTQASLETAITGRAYDILEQANLAEQLALQEENRILGEVAANKAQREAKYESDINRALAPLAPPSVKELFTGDFTRRLEQMPQTAPTVRENLGKALATRDIVGATLNEREADRALAELASTVDPGLQLSQGILAYSPAELAQEIAVRQYGMNPQLAAGSFGPDFEQQYYSDLIALDTAQRDYERMQQGFYPETMEETIFRIGGADALDQYRLDMAQSAMGNDPESLAKEQEREQSGFNEQVDAELAQNYFGLTPSQIDSRVDEPVIRSTMADPAFLEAFKALAADFQPGGAEFNMADTQEMRRMRINELAFEVYPTSPVKATILADMIASWSLTGP